MCIDLIIRSKQILVNALYVLASKLRNVSATYTVQLYGTSGLNIRPICDCHYLMACSHSVSSLCYRINSDKNVVLNLFVVVVVLHASLRLRNVKNKIASKVEYIGISRTPMGLLLEALGMEQEAAS